MTHEHSADCGVVLEHVQAFLDNELDSATEEAVRAHIAICEPCLDQADVWMAVKTLVKRACTSEAAPEYVVAKVSQRLTKLRMEMHG